MVSRVLEEVPLGREPLILCPWRRKFASFLSQPPAQKPQRVPIPTLPVRLQLRTGLAAEGLLCSPLCLLTTSAWTRALTLRRAGLLRPRALSALWAALVWAGEEGLAEEVLELGSDEGRVFLRALSSRTPVSFRHENFYRILRGSYSTKGVPDGPEVQQSREEVLGLRYVWCEGEAFLTHRMGADCL